MGASGLNPQQWGFFIAPNRPFSNSAGKASSLMRCPCQPQEGHMSRFDQWVFETAIIWMGLWGVLAILHFLFDMDAVVEAVGNWVLS